MTWKLDDPQGNEAAKCRWDVVPYIRGKGIDVGCGPTKVLPHAIGIDSQKDTELFGVQMKPDLVCEDACKLAIPDADLDFVFSSHLIEHLNEPARALSEWWRCLKVGGHLILYWPDPNEYPRVGQPGSNPDHKADYQPEDMIAMMEKVGNWDLLVNERRNGGMEYSVLQVYKKL